MPKEQPKLEPPGASWRSLLSLASRALRVRGPTDCPLSLMPRTSVPPGTANFSGCPSACALLLVLLVLVPSGGHAELLGTYPHRNGMVQLMTDLCREEDPSAGQRAQRTFGGREQHGCWGVDRAGNPVVTWSDGSELELDGDKVRLSRRIARLLEEPAAAPLARSPAATSVPTVRPGAEVPRAAAPAAPSRSTAPPPDFARPAWCTHAHFPHERLVCTDPELAARDLRLASLWRPYRSTLSRAEEAWHKSDYFRRLKACGADRACIVSEQETQMRRYRDGLLGGI